MINVIKLEVQNVDVVLPVSIDIVNGIKLVAVGKYLGLTGASPGFFEPEEGGRR